MTALPQSTGAQACKTLRPVLERCRIQAETDHAGQHVGGAPRSHGGVRRRAHLRAGREDGAGPRSGARHAGALNLACSALAFSTARQQADSCQIRWQQFILVLAGSMELAHTVPVHANFKTLCCTGERHGHSFGPVW